jgi:endonuclease-8
LPVGEALLQQTIACGVGNVYKSETLFLAGLDPWRPVADLGPDERLEVYRLAQRLMLRNRRGGVRRTRFAVDGPPLWVYGRVGEPCLRCGGAIAVRRQGAAGRTTYWCRACQPAAGRD